MVFQIFGIKKERKVSLRHPFSTLMEVMFLSIYTILYINVVLIINLFQANLLFLDPHIGHIYSAVLADAAHRWELLKARKDSNKKYPDFKFVTGTDEYGTKIQTAAAKCGLPPQKYVDQNSRKFQEAFKNFGIINTDFIRTSDEKHKKAVSAFWVNIAL